MTNIDLFKHLFKELMNGDINVTEFLDIFNKELFVEEYLKDLNNRELEIINEVKNSLDKKLKTNKAKKIVNEALKKIELLKNKG